MSYTVYAYNVYNIYIYNVLLAVRLVTRTVDYYRLHVKSTVVHTTVTVLL